MTDAPAVKPRIGFLDWLDERKLIGVLLLLGDLSLMHALIYDGAQIGTGLDELISGGIGGLTTAVGIMAQSIYRESKSDKANADTMASLAAAANPSPSPPPNPTPAPDGAKVP